MKYAVYCNNPMRPGYLLPPSKGPHAWRTMIPDEIMKWHTRHLAECHINHCMKYEDEGYIVVDLPE